MAINALNTNLDSLRSLKKRKMEVYKTFNDDLSNNDETSIDIEYIKKENDETPTKKKNENKILQINCSNKEKTNILQDSDVNYKLSIRKIEDLRKTPISNKSSNESIHRNRIKNENTPSPAKFSASMLSINSSESKYNTIKELQETPTPTKNKKLHSDEFSTPTKRKKRKINDIGEYDYLSDPIKTELDNDTLNEMEHIEMLHDLDFVMDFKDTKTSIFVSSTNDTQHEENIDVLNDPQIDPLSIDIHDTFVKTRKRKQTKIIKHYNTRLRNKRKNMKINLNNKKHADETPSGIKIALGELHIPSDTENKELSKDAIQKLYDLKVQLMHDVPPQHKIPSNLSRSMTRAQKNLFLEHASLRRGNFLPYEDEIIKNNWKKFCEVHDWNPEIIKPFLYMRNHNKCYIKSYEERQKFFQYLANGLPCRSLNSVLERCKNLFIKYEKCFQRYCTEEDEIILSYMKNIGKNRKLKKRNNYFNKLAEMLKRRKDSVRLRYHMLKNMQISTTNKPIVHVDWTLELVGEFIHNLMDVSLCGKVEELKNAILPKPIWLKLEEKLNINWNVLKKFWNYRLHLQLFCSEPIYLNDIRIKLIEYIYGKGISSTREIMWPSVARYFDGVTSVVLCRIFLYMAHQAAKKICTTDFPDIIEYLYSSKVPEIKHSSIDKFLPRLSYKNKNVKIIDEDNDNTAKKF